MSGLLFVFLFVFLLIGVPISFAIALAGCIFMALSDINIMIFAQKLTVGIDSFLLLAVPLFILAGYLMEASGVSKRLVSFIELLFGRVSGAMGVVTIVACTFFAALTGSGPATVAAIGSIMIPLMKQYGYKDETAVGLTVAAGALGPIIPPSIPIIVYGCTMSISVTKLFLGAVVPGLLISGVLIVTNMIIASKQKIKGSDKKYSRKEAIQITVQAMGPLMLPIIILGGIYGGIFTPTEAATVAVIVSIILGMIYKELTWKNFIFACNKTVSQSSMIVFIIGCATSFGWLLAITNVTKNVAASVIQVINNKYVYLLVLNILLFIVGALMDTLASIAILAPVLIPIGIALGIDALHLGIVFCVNLIVGFVTPPFGVNLFTASSLTGMPFTKVVKGAFPFMIAMIIAVFIITYIPEIVLFLPNL